MLQDRDADYALGSGLQFGRHAVDLLLHGAETPGAVSDAVPDGQADLPIRPHLPADVLQVELLQLRVLTAAPHSHDAGGAEVEDALQELVQRVVGVAHHQDGSAAHRGVGPHLPVLQQDLGHLETHVRFARAWRALDDGQLFGQRSADCFHLNKYSHKNA